jgi:outer membrane protein
MILLISANLQAAEGRTLSWPDCVNLVADNNPTLKSSHENVASSDELVGSAKSGFLPVVTGAVDASHEFPNANIPYLTSQTGVAYTSSLSLDYNLFSGFKDVATVKQAKANFDVARANLDLTRASVSDNLRQAFIRLNYAQAYVKLTAVIIDSRVQNERLVRAQYESGTENQGSYLLAQAKLEQSKFDHLQAEHGEVIARETLAHVLGDEDSDITLIGSVPQTDPPDQAPLRDLVFKTPTHRAQEGNVDVSRANVQLSRSGFLPSLDFVGTVLNQNQLLYTNNQQQWSVGLTLTIPLFSGLSTYHNTKSAHDLERSSVDTEVATDFGTYDTLRANLFGFQEAVLLLKVNQINLNALTVQERIARKQYNNGLVTFEDWDIIEGNLVDAQKTELASERDRAIAESTWRNSQGLGDLP